MKESNFWKIIKEKYIVIINLLIGSLILLALSFNFIETGQAIPTILGLLLLSVTTELIERQKRFSILEDKLEEIKNINLNHGGIAQIKILKNSYEALNYVEEKTQNAEFSILQASIDKMQKKTTSSERIKYEKIRARKIKKDTVEYRYIGMLHNQRRISLFKDYLNDDKINKFFLGFFIKKADEFPFMNFTIFDRKYVIARSPNEYGKSNEYIVIESTDAAKLFLSYFEKLWNKAIKVKSLEECMQLKEQIKE